MPLMRQKSKLSRTVKPQDIDLEFPGLANPVADDTVVHGQLRAGCKIKCGAVVTERPARRQQIRLVGMVRESHVVTAHLPKPRTFMPAAINFDEALL